jgi:hypothetical protein
MERMLMIDVDDIPAVKRLRYPERITIPVTAEAKGRLDLLKREMKKDTSELVRMLLEQFFATIDWGVET